MSKLDMLIADVNKQYKEKIVSKGIPKVFVEKIPFSSPRANYMTYGGLPRNRLIEFAGEESSGKTTTALDICANAQKLFYDEFNSEADKIRDCEKLTKQELQRIEYIQQKGPKQILYVDCENTLDEDWAKLIGVEVEEMTILKPLTQTAEQIFEIVLNAIETDEVGLVVIDSLGVMLSQQAYDKTMEEKTYGGIAMALTLFSKKAELSCTKYGCTLIGINQMRDDMNSSYGGMITTGGKGWKHNCSMRLMFHKGDYIDQRGNTLKRSAEEPMGNIVQMNIIKTKVCKPDRRVGCYTLRYNEGIDVISDTIDVAMKYNIIQQAGAWYSIVDTETGEILCDDGEVLKFQGKPNLIEYKNEHDDVINTIYEKINNLIKR